MIKPVDPVSIPRIAGRRLEGTILLVPVKRLHKTKSPFLRKLENMQKPKIQESTNVTPIRKKSKSVK